MSVRRKANYYTKRRRWLWIVLGGGENWVVRDVGVVVGRIGENVGCGESEDSSSVEDDGIGEECG